YFGQDAERLLSWCKDASGSRIIEAIISSPHVPKRTKNRVLQGYVGRFVDLAVDKYGSHVVDSCWAAAGIEFKEKIVGELVRGEARLQDSPFGRTVLRNCGAEQYKRRADEWRQRERNIEKRKRVFKDIVGSDAPAASRRPAKDAAKSADEIDVLFGATQQLAALGATAPTKIETAGDKSLQAVADALAGTKRKKAKAKAEPEAVQAGATEQAKAKRSKKEKDAARKDRRAFAR
ncbi:Nucleolar protein 9, partial [Coemansia nantahalensis]